jgi:hypothetical protein
MIYKSNEPLHIDGAIKHNHAKGRLETSPTKGEACHSTFGLDSNYMAKWELLNICQQESHASSGPS